MDIIVLILIFFSAGSVMTVVRVIIKRRKKRCESKKEEEKTQETQEKLVKKAAEELQKWPEVEAKAKEEAESVAKRTEDEAKRAAEERLRKEREKALRKEVERLELEKIKAEEEKIEREAREKVSKEKVERERLEAVEKEYKAEQKAKTRKAEEEKARKKEDNKKEELEHCLKEEKARLEEIKQLEEVEKQKLAKRLPPGQRGGRPRGTAEQGSSKQSPPEQKPRSLKPEIICWNKGWEWIVGIEVPEEFASPRVTQNDELLEQDTSDDTRYYLRYLEGSVKVVWTEREQDREIEIPIMEDERNYLICKMRRDWKGLGRVVRRPTTGFYLAIVPYNWKYNEEISGSFPVKPEKVQINGYKAYFFTLGQNNDKPIQFIDENGERIRVETGGSRFKLVGKEISDSSEDMGPLFGEEPPLIKTIDEREWDNVGVVVVGEEGSGRNRCRTQFRPQEGAEEQRMPDELINRKGGWYFVRIYDNNDDLLESLDFRFIAGLKDIQIMTSKPVPELNGYNDVAVQFIHQANCKVETDDEYPSLTIRRENALTIITIPPRPDCDKTHWILSDGNAKIKVTVLVERVWWCVDSLAANPEKWTNKTVSLSRKEFTATTDKTLWVKFPRKRWLSKIEVGFNRTRSRYYNVEVEKEEIAVPLRDFCDAEEIGNKQVKAAMKIWITPWESKTYEAIVLVIPTESMPAEEPGEVQVKPLQQQPTQSQPEVKSCRGKRKGKGFSRNEIENAGLAMGEVKFLHIPYDKRRKSSHSWNIEKLKSIIKR